MAKVVEKTVTPAVGTQPQVASTFAELASSAATMLAFPATQFQHYNLLVELGYHKAVTLTVQVAEVSQKAT